MTISRLKFVLLPLLALLLTGCWYGTSKHPNSFLSSTSEYMAVCIESGETGSRELTPWLSDGDEANRVARAHEAQTNGQRWTVFERETLRRGDRKPLQPGDSIAMTIRETGQSAPVRATRPEIDKSGLTLALDCVRAVKPFQESGAGGEVSGFYILNECDRCQRVTIYLGKVDPRTGAISCEERTVNVPANSEVRFDFLTANYFSATLDRDDDC